jgi:glycosyltransferase involved in cell wall biosynthesis
MFRAQRPSKGKLVLLGPENSSYGKLVRAEILKLGLADEVILIAKIPYNELPGYYQHAKINLFASSCENCPNILLEQLAAGRAILSSHYQPMPEIASAGALFFDPYNTADLCQLLLNTIDDSAKLDKMGNEARNRSGQFSWAKTRKETWQALMELG